MNIVLYLLFGVVLLSCNGKKENTGEPQHQITTSKPSHSVWNMLLQRYVDENGNVSYSGFKQDGAQLSAYLDHLAQHPPSQTWSKEDALAYYINLYNAATVKLIVDHYPVESIKDIPNRWGKKWIQVGNSTLSLDYIEHQILREMNEPRIHFAINCASYSCPKLLNEAFTAKKMEQLLSKVTMDFVNDPTKNRFENDEAQLSKIFKWYKGDFTKDVSLLEYINPYLKNPVNKDADIDYLDYDWSLNDAK
ncbi:DUF547 domain-containing protein [Allomuricauda sp. CP2A]|jgi:hypothetical protein|uniref:DUF547 domain-containing protein n=1 Tax=Allomuricauda sp. CP2A TaxID=1848189 RepID=UPI00082EC237|nr:DUF547 domain-containing protein [Muricauda sp. CP2A]